jgi:uncharacterized membrane protein (DUF106 family)
MNNLFGSEHIHGFHIIFALFCIVRIIFIFGKWAWIKEALSEKGAPSSMRLSGYNIVELVCLCEFWHTMKSGAFDTTHLLYLLTAIGVLFGLIKMAQLPFFNNGKSAPADSSKTE